MTVLMKVCNIKMEQATFDDIQHRADKKDLTVSEYIRRAVRVINVIEDVQLERDCRLILRDGDGAEMEVFLLW